MKLRFGTDGVRGRAYDELSVADAASIGRAAAAVLGGTRAIIGHDARQSGEDLAAGLAHGLAEAGVTAEFLGVAPTPAVAHLAATDMAIGVMVSASHNPWHDNGIKIFAPGGLKLTDAQQASMEALLAEDQVATDLSGAPGAAAQSLVNFASIEPRVGEYARHVASTVPDGVLDGMRIVLDAANGAGSHVAGPVLRDLGADVTVLSSSPSGTNINDGCGSTHPEALAAAVVEQSADLGLALDGDADRLLAVDHTGAVVDGDQVIAICAIDRAARGVLAGNVVVVTVMTNLGFRQSMEQRGIEVAETSVGDRNVLEALDANGWTLGGEQSGHVIFRDLATTGDGLLSGLQLAATVARLDRTLHDLAEESMVRLPQVLKNVRVAERVPDVAAQVAAEIAEVESGILAGAGRVLVRASGTEPLIRVMVEAPTESLATEACDILISHIEARFT